MPCRRDSEPITVGHCDGQYAGDMATTGGNRRQRGSVRRRGNSYQVSVYSGLDPLTGRRMYETDSTTSPKEVESIRARLITLVDQQRHARTKATFRTTMEAWLKIHEVEHGTSESYANYGRDYLYPAFGHEPVSRVNAQLLKTLYAELRRCRVRCDR